MTHKSKVKLFVFCYFSLFITIHSELHYPLCVHLSPHLFPFRGALPACRPAKGLGLASGAEEPAAARPNRLPSKEGRDWKRVRPLPWKTCWALHLQDQEVKATMPLKGTYNALAVFGSVPGLNMHVFFDPVSSGRSPVVTRWPRSGWPSSLRPAKRVRTTADWVRAATMSSSSLSHTAWTTHNVLPRRCWHKHVHYAFEQVCTGRMQITTALSLLLCLSFAPFVFLKWKRHFVAHCVPATLDYLTLWHFVSRVKTSVCSCKTICSRLLQSCRL